MNRSIRSLYCVIRFAVCVFILYSGVIDADAEQPNELILSDPGIVFVPPGMSKFLGVHGHLGIVDCMSIKSMAERFCLTNGGRIRYAEIGSYLGLSATIVLHSCSEALVFAHDIFPIDPANLSPEGKPPADSTNMLYRFWEGIRLNNFEGRVIPMRGLSKETMEVNR
jgi:hypothetical protein